MDEDRREIIEILNKRDEEVSRDIDKYIKEHNLIPVPYSGDPVEECKIWFRKWWKENNMTPEKFKKTMLDFINKYAEIGETND